MNYCSFCGKSIGHLVGIYKERHFDQCLTQLETEQYQAEERERLTTFAGHSIPFLQDLDLCPCCHELFPSGGLRGKVGHIKRCAKQRSLSMDQLLRKFQWMQWGHLPLPNPPQVITSPAPATVQYSVRATDTRSDSISSTSTSKQLDPITTTTPMLSDNNNLDGDDEEDDFNNKVVVYKMASWRQTRIKAPKPTEDETIAMALSLSLHEDSSSGDPSNKSRRRKRKVDWNVSNIISIEESKASARLALKRMLEKDTSTTRIINKTPFPLVTSQVKPIVSPYRRSQHHRLSSTPILWSQAACL
ncbi:hypothetical protein BC941DRAFT_432206, partial [Chlamydoabsidia padenii]